MTYYHVTPIQNWENIKINGLIPAKIKRGKGFEESLPAVYFFNSISDAEDGFFNWYEDEYEDDVEFVLLRINISSDEIIPDPEIPLSCSMSFKVIPAECIDNLGIF